MLRVVVDTNIWIRTLLGEPVTVPILGAWRADLRADDELRALMEQYGVQFWGVGSLLECIRD